MLFPVKPLVALLLAISLGGCVGYAGYPSGYGYNQPTYSQPTYSYSNYPNGYYGRSYQRPLYSPYYEHATYGG